MSMCRIRPSHLGLLVVLFLAGCHSGHHHHQVDNVRIDIDVSTSILADTFAFDPSKSGTSVYLEIIDEDSGFLQARRRVFGSFDTFRTIQHGGEHLGYYLVANGRYFGRILLVDVLIDFDDEAVNISFGRDLHGRVTTLVNGVEVAVYFDPCLCFDA